MWKEETASSTSCGRTSSRTQLPSPDRPSRSRSRSSGRRPRPRDPDPLSRHHVRRDGGRVRQRAERDGRLRQRDEHAGINVQWSFNAAAVPDGTVLSFFDPSASMTMAASSPLGPGSLQLDLVSGPLGGTYFFAVTLVARHFSVWLALRPRHRVRGSRRPTRRRSSVFGPARRDRKLQLRTDPRRAASHDLRDRVRLPAGVIRADGTHSALLLHDPLTPSSEPSPKKKPTKNRASRVNLERASIAPCLTRTRVNDPRRASWMNARPETVAE